MAPDRAEIYTGCPSMFTIGTSLSSGQTRVADSDVAGSSVVVMIKKQLNSQKVQLGKMESPLYLRRLCHKTLDSYREAIRDTRHSHSKPNGAIFFAIYRGKISEGIPSGEKRQRP